MRSLKSQEVRGFPFKMMKLRSILTGPILVCLLVCAITYGAAATDENEQQQQQVPKLRKFELPKIFDFSSYAKLYRKHYRGPAEWMNRARLFLARAYRVFIQGVKYSHRLSGKYFALNAMSDWTREERRASFGLRLSDNGPHVIGAGADESVGFNSENIRREFDEIVRSKQEGRQHRADPIQTPRRQRRDVTGQQPQVQVQMLERHLTTDELMRDPSQVVESRSPKLYHEFASDEPSGPQVEVESSEADIPEEVKDQISESKSLVGSLMNSLSQRLFKHDYQPLSAGASSPADESDDTDEILLDYRKTGCLAAVRGQSQCGSCYIFSTIAMYEYQNCIQTERLVEFSEQYPIDCGINYGLNGCAGGQPMKVGEFVGNFGLEPRDYYPYKAQDRTCPYKVESQYELMGRIRVTKDSSVVNIDGAHLDNDMIQFLLETKGPLSFAIVVNDEYLDYGGGIDNLGDYEAEGGHAMVLIGHGRQNGRDYWLLRNSHGSSWGEGGHYKLDKRFNWKQMLQVDLIQAKFEPNPKHDVQTIKQGLYRDATLGEKLISWINPFHGV